MSPVPAAVLLAALAAAALLAQHVAAAGAVACLLLIVCLRGPRGRRRLYVLGAVSSGLGIFVLSPFLQTTGATVVWSGPTVPVLGVLDVTVEELRVAALNGLRLAAVGLAFSVYALLLDHDRLVGAVGFARRSSLAVALATRLVPTLERDAAGLADAFRGRGLLLEGVRPHARLLSPLVAGSLERAGSLAEAMEARGFGAAGATRAPRAAWTPIDWAAAAAAAPIVVAGLLWL